MGYYVDLASISLDDYRMKLESSFLPPSRMILKEKLKERFSVFSSIGLKNVEELQKILKRKDKFSELSKAESLSADYLTILLREINSINPKPCRLRDFPGVSASSISKLEKLGIKDTPGLFMHVLDPARRKELADRSGVSCEEILELTCLTDLCRIKWVGVAFARILITAGIDSVIKAAEADYLELHKKLVQMNKDSLLYKGQIGLNDMKIFVQAAREISQEIVY